MGKRPQLMREDILDLTDIKSVGDLETLYCLMASKVGSSFSIPTLSRDLNSAYRAASCAAPVGSGCIPNGQNKAMVAPAWQGLAALP